MSRVRTRPTRDDTCEKLFEAAAKVFEEQGIGGASIEAIAAAAGFRPGAFYLDFKSMDRTRQDALGRAPLLHMEMILYVARAEQRRPELAKRLRARRKLVAEIVETTTRSRGFPAPNAAWTSA